MTLKPRSLVRQKKGSILLFVERIDAETGMVHCKKIGPKGPEGRSSPYPADQLDLVKRRAISVVFT
jgi:hypothetical protein